MLEFGRLLVVVFTVLFFVAGVQAYETTLDGLMAVIVATPALFGLYVVNEDFNKR